MSRRDVPGGKDHRRWSTKAAPVDPPMSIEEYDQNRTYYERKTKEKEEQGQSVEGTVGTLGTKGGYGYGYANNERFCSGYAMDPHM